METLIRSLRNAPVVGRDDYDYFVHPVTDGLPLVEPALLREIADEIRATVDLDRVDKIVAPEAMGVHLATALSMETGVPFVVVRKRSYGFPGEVAVHQETGYSEGELFVNEVDEDDRVLFLDDVYATGGTLEAVCSALLDVGVELVDVVVVIQRGTATTEHLPYDVTSLVRVEVADGRVVVQDPAARDATN